MSWQRTSKDWQEQYHKKGISDEDYYGTKKMSKPKDKKFNMNDLAVQVSKLEGGKENLSIAQIKEVMRCLSDVLLFDPNRWFDVWNEYLDKRASEKRDKLSGKN